MTARDPRSAPMAGDAVRSTTSHRERWINSVHGDEISYLAFTHCASGPARRTRNVCPLLTWQKWCRDSAAVVVARGEEA